MSKQKSILISHCVYIHIYYCIYIEEKNIENSCVVHFAGKSLVTCLRNTTFREKNGCMPAQRDIL